MTRARALALLAALGAGAAFCAPAPSARAEQGEPPHALFVRLAPTARQWEDERTRALEQRLAALLASWPGVLRAQVQLTLPSAAEQPLDRPLPAPRATVVLTRAVGARGHGAEPPEREAVLALVRGVVPTLVREDLTLLEHAALDPRAPRSGARKASATTWSGMRAGLTLSLVVNVLLAVIVLSRPRRNRPAAQKVDPAARWPSPP